MENITKLVDSLLALIGVFFVAIIVPILGADYFGNIIWPVWLAFCFTITAIALKPKS